MYTKHIHNYVTGYTPASVRDFLKPSYSVSSKFAFWSASDTWCRNSNVTVWLIRFMRRKTHSPLWQSASKSSLSSALDWASALGGHHPCSRPAPQAASPWLGHDRTRSLARKVKLILWYCRNTKLESAGKRHGIKSIIFLDIGLHVDLCLGHLRLSARLFRFSVVLVAEEVLQC